MPGQPGPRRLARLLADLSRDALDALCTRWGLTESETAAPIASLYRRMTDADAWSAAIAGLPGEARAVFERLAAARHPVTVRWLARSVSLPPENVECALTALAALGLAWTVPRARDASTAEGTMWFVPIDFHVSRRPRRSGSGAVPPPADRRHDVPLLLTSQRPPESIVPGGMVAGLIEQIGSADAGSLAPVPPAVQTYAVHCGLRLGIWEQKKGHLVPGPRLLSWRRLDHLSRIRALGRLWLVDESAPGAAPAWLRHGLCEALRRCSPAAWYDLNTLARYIVRATASAGPASEHDHGRASRRALARRDLESAIQTLGWIGILQVGVDHRGRLLAVQLTAAGREALA
ncbi:MAG TPA: hypothetical protein VKY56_05560 [Chloroflexota bacterium]|nr:hypothetical protein [Chloroflexota bacterium]